MNKNYFWLGFLSGAVLFAITGFLLYQKYAVQPDISLNNMEVKTLQGEKVEPNSFIGKPLVVNYWATWCVPCIQEMPHFEKIKKEFEGKVHFVMISDETQDKIVKFSQSKPFQFNYLRSEKNLSELGINSRPTTYFYNAKGELVTKHTSSLTEEELRKLTEKIK